MKKLVWVVAGIAVLLLAFWLLQILVIYPEQARTPRSRRGDPPQIAFPGCGEKRSHRKWTLG